MVTGTKGKKTKKKMARDRRRKASRLPTTLLLLLFCLLLLPSSWTSAAATAEEAGEDYSHFAEILATVMVLREGGVEEAMGAVPALHDVTHATIVALVSLAEEEEARRRSGGSSASATSSSGSSSPSFSASAFDPASWPGLTAAQASALASNYSKASAATTTKKTAAATAVTTLASSAAELKRAVASGGGVNKSADPLFLAGERLGAALDPALERKAEAGLPAPLEAKLRALGTSLEAKANATAEDAQTDAFLRDVNAKLASFNVELSSKGSVAREPRRFANAAAAIQRAVTGTALSVRGVNFAPCLVSVSIRGASVGATAVVSNGLSGGGGEGGDCGFGVVVVAVAGAANHFQLHGGDNSKYRKKKKKTTQNRTWPAGSSLSTRRPRRSRCRAST